MKTSLDIFQDFPLEITQSGHQYTFAQVENNHKGKSELTHEYYYKVRRLNELLLSSGVCEPQKQNSYSPNLPTNQTNFTLEQREQTAAAHKPFYFITGILCHRGKRHRRAAVGNSNVLLRLFFTF